MLFIEPNTAVYFEANTGTCIKKWLSDLNPHTLQDKIRVKRFQKANKCLCFLSKCLNVRDKKRLR